MFTGNIQIPKIFPSLPNVADVQILWDNFKNYTYMNFYGQAIANMDEQEIEDFTKKLTSLYQTKNVTPYMHALVAHMYQNF